MYYYIIDDATTKRGFYDIDRIYAKDFAHALAEAEDRWNSLSEKDKADRDYFAFGESELEDVEVPEQIAVWEIFKD